MLSWFLRRFCEDFIWLYNCVVRPLKYPTMSQEWCKALLSGTERWGFIHIFCSVEHFGLSDHFLPALTCCHSENKRRIQGNSQTIVSTASVPIKRKRPERTGKAPITPVKTHLAAQQIPLKTLTSPHYKLFCNHVFFFFWTRLDKSLFLQYYVHVYFIFRLRAKRLSVFDI